MVNADTADGLVTDWGWTAADNALMLSETKYLYRCIGQQYRFWPALKSKNCMRHEPSFENVKVVSEYWSDNLVEI